MQTLVAFDIGNTALRNRVENACRDVGMIRVQWSLFQGELDPERRRKLVAAMERHVREYTANESAKQRHQALLIHLFTLCAADFGNALEINRKKTRPAEPVIPPRIVIL